MTASASRSTARSWWPTTNSFEATREHALPPGRALFQRQGMAGWMQVWRSCLDKPGSPPGPAPSASSPLSGGLRAEFAILLAGMILGQRQECTP